MKYNFVTIEGNIGAGKTSLAEKLADEFNAKLILEQFEDNPFLAKFYKDPSKYAFLLELTFLAERFQQLRSILADKDMLQPQFVSDYFISKSLIFARKTLQDKDFTIYSRFFDIINANLPAPDLLIYLYVSVERLKENIIKRGRPYEQDIKTGYLEQIQESYLNYMQQQTDMRILIVDANDLDFVEKEGDYHKLLSTINREYPLGVHCITP